MLAAFGVFRGVGLGAAGTGHVVAPVFVEFAEDLELFGEIELLAVFRGGIDVGVRFVAGAVVGVVVRTGVVVVLFLLFEADAVHGELFEGGIALELFLNDGAQVEGGDLEDFERLPQLRG